MTRDVYDIAKVAYEAYTTYRQQKDCPDWKHLPDNTREAWVVAVAAVAGQLGRN